MQLPNYIHNYLRGIVNMNYHLTISDVNEYCDYYGNGYRPKSIHNHKTGRTDYVYATTLQEACEKYLLSLTTKELTTEEQDLYNYFQQIFLPLLTRQEKTNDQTN